MISTRGAFVMLAMYAFTSFVRCYQALTKTMQRRCPSVCSLRNARANLRQWSQWHSIRPIHRQVYLCIPRGALHFQSSVSALLLLCRYTLCLITRAHSFATFRTLTFVANSCTSWAKWITAFEDDGWLQETNLFCNEAICYHKRLCA